MLKKFYYPQTAAECLKECRRHIQISPISPKIFGKVSKNDDERNSTLVN